MPNNTVTGKEVSWMSNLCLMDMRPMSFPTCESVPGPLSQWKLISVMHDKFWACFDQILKVNAESMKPGL